MIASDTSNVRIDSNYIRCEWRISIVTHSFELSLRHYWLSTISWLSFDSFNLYWVFIFILLDL